MSDAVYIRGIEFDGNHGWTEEERQNTRRFRVHVETPTSLTNASATDELADTVDYKRICEIVVEEGTQKTYRLLERLGGAIAKRLKEEWPQNSFTLEIEKLAAPCPGTPDCGVRLHVD